MNQEIRFVAEMGSNHNGSIERCADQIRYAKQVGCWASKFQYFKAERLYHPSQPDMIKQAKAWELPTDFLPDIATLCREAGLVFICSVFDILDIEYVVRYADVLKIASYEALWPDLVKACNHTKTGKPLMISTGTCTIGEVNQITQIASPISEEDVLFHCVSGCPAAIEEANTTSIRFLSSREEQLQWPNFGWSDHTVNPGVIYSAVGNGATYIECHFDMDGRGWEASLGHCWSPSGLRKVIRTVRDMEEATGYWDKQPSKQEKLHQLMWRTDPSDGLRPLKEFREKGEQKR